MSHQLSRHTNNQPDHIPVNTDNTSFIEAQPPIHTHIDAEKEQKIRSKTAFIAPDRQKHIVQSEDLHLRGHQADIYKHADEYSARVYEHRS